MFDNFISSLVMVACMVLLVFSCIVLIYASLFYLWVVIFAIPACISTAYFIYMIFTKKN